MTRGDRSASGSPDVPAVARRRAGLANVAADALSAVTWRSRVAGLAALLLLLLTAFGTACSHGSRLTKVVRTDKTSVIGTLVAMRPDVIVLKTPGGVTVEIPRKEISSIEAPTLSEIAAIQGAGSGASAANGGTTNPSGGAATPAGGGSGPGAGQSANAGGSTSGSGIPGAGGTGDARGGGASGGPGNAGNPFAPGQQAGNPGGGTGQPGGAGSTGSYGLPAGGGLPGTGGPGGGTQARGGPGGTGGPANAGGSGGGASGAMANRDPSGRGGVPSSAGTPADPTSGSASSRAPSSGSAPTGARGVLLPANAEMTVSLESELGSDTSRAEEDVYATLTRPVTIDGVTRVPAGARLRGTITEAVPGAKARGRGRLAVRFHTLIVDSASIPIETHPMRYVAGRLSKEDAKKIGMGAAAGAAIGRIISKTKQGLGIGAAAGAGGTAAALSRRPDIRLESGTTLRIKLQKLVPQPAS